MTVTTEGATAHGPAHAVAGAKPAVHAHGQQHPIRIYLTVWVLLFVLSTASYLVDYFDVHGMLRWFLILLFMWLKAGFIVAIFMHMAWERLALVFAILTPPMALIVFMGMMAFEGDYTNGDRQTHFLPAAVGTQSHEAPAVEAPAVEAPAAVERRATETPTAEKPAVEAPPPAAEKQVTEPPAPVAEKPAAETPAKAEKEAIEAPASEAPAAPAIDKPASEGPTAEKPSSEAPAAEESRIEAEKPTQAAPEASAAQQAGKD